MNFFKIDCSTDFDCPIKQHFENFLVYASRISFETFAILSFLAYSCLLKTYLFPSCHRSLPFLRWYPLSRRGLIYCHFLVVHRESLRDDLCPIVKDHFLEMANKLLLSLSIHFESTDKEDHHNCLKLFDDHLRKEGILISSHSFLRMTIEKKELHGLTGGSS